MPRNMSGAMATAVAATELQPALFVSASFVTGPIYVWTGFGSVVWGGFTWLGVGNLGGISVIEEGASVEAKGVTLSLSGIDATLLTDVLREFQLGAPVTVWLGLFTTAMTLIADPIVAWSGRMDQPTIDVAAETAVISINCESRLLDMNVAVQRRLTNDDQQLEHPGDRGLEFVTGIQETIIYWGRTPSSSNNL